MLKRIARNCFRTSLAGLFLYAALFAAAYGLWGITITSISVVVLVALGIRNVACAGISRRVPVGNLLIDGWAGSSAGDRTSQWVAGTESCAGTW